MLKQKGQTMVEFALILPILLLVIFIIVESGRIFQAYVTVQNAARAGARYAVTGQWEEQFAAQSDPRLASIIDVATGGLAGLAIEGPAGYDANGVILPRRYEIKIFCQIPGGLAEGCAGGPNEKMAVQVAYRLEIITPVLNTIAPSVQVVGYAEMINEDFGQFGGGGFAGVREPPSPIPPEIATAGASPTPTQTPTGTTTPTPTTTGTPTITPTPTSTPVCAVIIQEPVYSADTTVTARGDPGDTIIIRDMTAGGALIASGTVGSGAYCNGSVAIPVNLTTRNGHIIAAISSRHPASDIACVGVTACWPTSTPTATPTPGAPTATPTATPSTPYIVLSRGCSLVGQAVDIRVYGYNWPTSSSKNIMIQWDGNVKTTFQSRATWDTVISISAAEATAATHTVRAALVQPPNDEDSKSFIIPCPPTPTPFPTPTPVRSDLRITSIVGPSSPIVAYAPVTFTVNVRNDGPGDALSLFWVDLYDLSEGSSPPTAGQSQGDVRWKAVSSLSAGDTEAVVLYYAFTESGNRVIYGYVDSRQNVDEVNETNNVSQPLALTISPGTAPTSTLTTDPFCSAEGVTTTITVRGQGWPTAGTVQILYDGNLKDSFSSQSNWSRPITISGTETSAMVHTIQALIPSVLSLEADYYIPCTAMGGIDGYTWIFIKGDVVPHNRTDVYCYDAGGNLIAQTTSDDSAYYIFNVPPGAPYAPYTVVGQTYVDAIWYMDTEAGISVSAGSTTRVNLVLVPQY